MEFGGAPGRIQGQIVNESASGTSFALSLQGGYRFDTDNALYAPWWLPDASSDGKITLFNSSNQSLAVVPSVLAGNTEQNGDKLILAAHETKNLTLRQLIQQNNATTGLLVLRYRGLAHALQPALVLENQQTGFLLAPGFNAKHDEAGQIPLTWQFPQVTLRDVLDTNDAENSGSNKLSAFALLANGTKSALMPGIVAYFSGTEDHEAQKAVLPITALAPMETRLVDLSQFVETGLISTKASHFALSVTHLGAPGDLGIVIFSSDPNHGAILNAHGILL